VKISESIIKDIKGMSKLKHEAEEAAKFRGHKLGKWSKFVQHHMSDATATCKKCKAWVIVNTKPKDDEVEMSGPAIAVNCTTRARIKKDRR
jgi:hypothetical protein